MRVWEQPVEQLRSLDPEDRSGWVRPAAGAAGTAKPAALADSGSGVASFDSLWGLSDHLDTVSSARDLDAVRRALGVAKISYFGETDGGLLGASYAAMYPHHVAAMVLDGAANHQLPTLERLISAPGQARTC